MIDYFNATKLCKDGGKKFKFWKENARSKELIRYYDQKSDSRNSGYRYVVSGGDKTCNELVSGTYLQEELILDIASWISIEFYDKCSKVIRNYFINEYKAKAEYYDKIKEDIAIKPQNKKKLQTLTIIDKNQPDKKGKYYVLKAMEENFDRSIKRLKEKYKLNLNLIIHLMPINVSKKI